MTIAAGGLYAAHGEGMSMPKVVIDPERCKQCMLCVRFCPRDSLRVSEQVNARGHYPVEQVDEESSTGCAICALVCPSVCIEVYR